MTTIERVAYALERLHLGGDFDWNRFHPEAKEMRLEQARAALQAIREPDDAMIEAGWFEVSCDHPFQSDLERGTEAKCFTAMIDAILEEKPE